MLAVAGLAAVLLHVATALGGFCTAFVGPGNGNARRIPTEGQQGFPAWWVCRRALEYRFHLLGFQCHECDHARICRGVRFAHPVRACCSIDGIRLPAILSIAPALCYRMVTCRTSLLLDRLRVSAPKLGLGLSVDDLGQWVCRHAPIGAMV